jgi:hypothetical protein
MNELEVLGKIQPGQKLSFKCGTVEIVDNPSRIGRWLSGDNKRTTLEGVTRIIEAAITEGRPINSDVVKGLDNLRLTYCTSKSVDIKLAELQIRIKEHSYQLMLKPWSN